MAGNVVFADAVVAASSDTAAATAVGVEGAAEGWEMHVPRAGGEEDGEDVLALLLALGRVEEGDCGGEVRW